MIFQLLVFVYFITTAFSSPISPYLVCEKGWHNILVFFATNYIAHALTAIPVPGANWLDHISFSLMALFLPYSFGLIEAVRSVTSYFLQGRSDDLHRALAENALLILVKREHIAPGDIEFVIKAFRLNFV